MRFIIQLHGIIGLKMSLEDVQIEVAQALEPIAGERELDLARLGVSRPTSAEFGDFAVNAAMVFAKDLGRNPRELAEQLAEVLQGQAQFERVEVAGPGFINIWMSDGALLAAASGAATIKPKNLVGYTVVSEYSDPNPFKMLHVGHLYTSVVGDAISNLMRAAGGKVHAVNFGGDVGLHVGKTMWAVMRELGGERPEKLAEITESQRASWLTKCYVAGSQAYEEDSEAKQQMAALNKKVYELVVADDHDSDFAKLYWTCRAWSYQAFDAFYARIGSRFEKYYPESETAPLGLETVREQLAKGVYSESDGAVVFRGEDYGLHTRVFITSAGLPTYEAKDVGLILAKWRDYHFDRSVVITGNDIVEYMKVVLKSVEQFAPQIVAHTTHLTHGNVRLAGGLKMSSRKGNVLGAEEALDVVAEANRRANGVDDSDVVLGAVKYAFLKQRIGADLVFVPDESVSLEGNSGPYLQYAHARARSISRKSGVVGEADRKTTLQPDERLLARAVAEYPDVVQRSVDELMPHHVAVYLYELAQEFNRFYERNRVIGDEREAVRLHLVNDYADVLKDGLELLGISAPDHI